MCSNRKEKILQDNQPVIGQPVSPCSMQGENPPEVSSAEYGPIQLADIPKILYEEFVVRYGSREESARDYGEGDFFRSTDVGVANCYICFGRMRSHEYLILIDEDPYSSLAVTIQDTMLMSVVVKPTPLGVSGRGTSLYQNKLFAVMRRKSIPLQNAYSRLMAEISVRAHMLAEEACETEKFTVKDGEEPYLQFTYSYERILFGEYD